MSVRSVHTGVVLDNKDPKKRGGLKVRVDTIAAGVPLGEDYVRPCFPLAGKGSGFFLVPKVGSIVEVEVEADGENALGSLDASWRAALYTDADALPSEFMSDYPNRGGVKFGDVLVLFDSSQDLLGLVSTKVRLGTEQASHPVIRGDTYNQQLDTFLTQLNTLATTSTSQYSALAAACSAPPLSALQPGFQALATGWTTFASAVVAFKGAAATWLSTRVKTE